MLMSVNDFPLQLQADERQRFSVPIAGWIG
jgi:hypothetical protein